MLERRLGRVSITYSKSLSFTRQRTETINLLPCADLFDKTAESEVAERVHHVGFIADARKVIAESSLADIIEYLVGMWVTSKLWNTYHAAEHVRPAFERSLNDLGLDYLDLYLIHFPLAQKFVPFETRYPPGWFTDPDAANPIVEEAKISIRETWHAMEELAKEGMTMMVVSHEMGFASQVASRVIFMDEGQIVEDCTKDDFFGSPRSDRAQLFLSKILKH